MASSVPKADKKTVCSGVGQVGALVRDVQVCLRINEGLFDDLPL